ncbi:MAG: hypothetical protein ABSB11_04945 [Sedimentisphaerales bacterium]|jgi:hypothetical protein
MKRLLAGLVVLAMFALRTLSYGAINSGHYVLVYTSTITAAQTVFDANNPVNLLSDSFLGYLAVDVCDTTDANNGLVFDSEAVIYNQKDKIYKLIPNAISVSPHDPRYIEMFSFTDFDFGFDVVGKGKATNVYEPNKHDPNTLVTKYVPTSMKGEGWFDELTLNVSNIFLSGTATVSLTLDSKLTASANSNGNNVDEVTNAIVTQLTLKDPNSWINWASQSYGLIDASDIAAILGQMSAGSIDGSDGNEFWPGTWFIYRTSEYRYGKMIVQAYDKAQNNELTLGWTTYNSDGSIYSSGTGLVIDGTYLCDLDEGQETFTSADFWWSIDSSTARSLVPENNALFELMYRAK